MPVVDVNTVKEIVIDKELSLLIDKANKVYHENFSKHTKFGRCIFLSWYCSLGNCDFCYRSVEKKRIENPSMAKRRRESLYTEALIAKKLNWDLEFLTGGYGIFPFDELVEITKVMHQIFGEKIWHNMGVMSKTQLEILKPYVKGVVASIETLEPVLHKKVAPGKPLAPFERMITSAKELGMQTGMTIILGLGEPKEDYSYVYDFIKKHDLDRITYYALRPVKGTPYTKGPDPEYVAYWIAKTRIDFPKIEISVGSAETRLPEISLFLKAGANLITKLPSTRLFGTEGAVKFRDEVLSAGRIFDSEFLNLPVIDWEKEVSVLDISEDKKASLVLKLKEYETKRLLKKYKSFKSLVCEPCSS
jgi:biotin synthase-like enzyme